MSELLLPDDHDGGMIKLCSWGAFSPDMEPYVELLPTNGMGTRTRFASKVAGQLRSKHAAELIRKFAAEVQPRPNSTYMLSTALGAYDYWGSNNNGDGFSEEELNNKEAEDVGYRSFVKHAHVFQHHKNKDPNRAMGRIVLASFNERMHRVELIEELDNVKAASHIRQWHETGSLPTSMGCKIAFDVCSICGNKAKTAKAYCEHAKYAMKRTLMDGRKVCVMNPRPRFFDHSHVNVPADKIAGVMEKVASVSFAGVDLPWDEMKKEGVLLSAVHGAVVFGPDDQVVEKTAAMGPTTNLSNEMVGEFFGSDLTDLAQDVIKVANDAEPTLPIEMLEKLAEYPLEDATASMVQLGIIPNPVEWQFLALCSGGQEKLARLAHAEGVCFEPTAPDVSDEGGESLFTASESVRPALVEKLAEFIPSRSIHPDFLALRVGVAAEWVKSGAVAVQQPWEIRQKSPSPAKTALALAASYALLRGILGKDAGIAKGLRELTGSHPAVAGAILGAGITAGLVVTDMLAGRNHRSDATTETSVGPIGPYTKLSCLMGDEPAEKVAGAASAMSAKDWLRKTPKSVIDGVLPLTAFSAGFLGSSYQRAKQLRGQPTGSTENVIADHPLGSAVAGVGGYALARRGLRKVVKTLR